MKIEYSEHALDQLFEREISKKDVENALRHGRSVPAHDGAIWGHDGNLGVEQQPFACCDILYKRVGGSHCSHGL